VRFSNGLTERKGVTDSYTVSSFVIFTVYRKLLTEQIKTDEIAKPVAGTRENGIKSLVENSQLKRLFGS
jgi:hypothetical protein